MQEILVVLVAVVTLFFIGRRLYKLFTAPTQQGCSNCSGCALKDCATRGDKTKSKA